jgi:hypothetical protein
MADTSACANAEPLSRLEQLERENADFRTWGIIEVAVRNPNVAEYMQHWEGRALRAEAALSDRAAQAERMARLEEALRSVEQWWLSEGMHEPGRFGAPYAIFRARSALGGNNG